MTVTAPTPTPPGPSPRRSVAPVLVAVVVVLAAVAVIVLVRRDWGGPSLVSTKGSGVAASQTRTVPAFTAVELAGANTVTVHVGGAQRVVVRADDNLVPLVITEVRAGTLVVSARRSFTTTSPMSVDVTVPSLESAAITGSGRMTIDGVRADTFTARLPGSGAMSASGSAARVVAEVSGSGDLRLDSLVGRDVTAVVSGSGRIAVDATASLDATVSGSGTVLYAGNPGTVTKNVTGSGAVVPQ
jgi:hypothetical protein